MDRIGDAPGARGERPTDEFGRAYGYMSLVAVAALYALAIGTAGAALIEWAGWTP